jgi:hypothetical protein
MKKLILTIPGAILVAAAALLPLCSSPIQTAGGGGTETVIGSVANGNGTAASNTLVRLFPASYNPAADTAVVYADTTDSSGSFAIAGVGSGDYTVYATGADKKTKALVLGIRVAQDTVRLLPAVLSALGCARIEAPADAPLSVGFVFVPGTDIVRKIDGATTSILFDSLPGGMLPSFTFYSASGPTTTAVLRDSVRVVPGDTALVANAGWRYARHLFVNTTLSGAMITGDVFGFPMLVRLGSANFGFSNAGLGGSDIRFTKADGTPLSFQVERWDAAVLAAEIWVKLDTVKGNDSTQSFFMYWGNPGAGSLSNGFTVFDTAAGFVGAWHMAENGATARRNSSQSRYDAAPANFTGSEHVPGVIAGADSLNGINEFYVLGSGMADWTRGITYSVWACPTSVVQCAAFMDFGNGTGGDNILFTRYNTTENMSVQIYNDTIDGGKTFAPSMLLGQWQHFAFTITGRQVTYYKNGELVKSDSSGQAIRSIIRNNNYFGKNSWAVPGDSYFAGMFDEIEISAVARNADWMKLSYETQKPGNTVLTFK